MAYNLEINSCEYNEQTGLVSSVLWTLSVELDGHKAMTQGSSSLSEKDINDPSFIPLENVTKLQAETWAKSVTDFSSLASSLENQIRNEQIGATVVSPPWIRESEAI